MMCATRAREKCVISTFESETRALGVEGVLGAMRFAANEVGGDGLNICVSGAASWLSPIRGVADMSKAWVVSGAILYQHITEQSTNRCETVLFP